MYLHEVEIAKLLLVAWNSPLALLDHDLDSLQNARVCVCNLVGL